MQVADDYGTVLAVNFADEAGPSSIGIGPFGTTRRSPAIGSVGARTGHDRAADRSSVSQVAVRVSSAINERALPAATDPHETRANAVLRPVVFGANDGLVSNLALVMGVAGATSEASIIVLAGVAGLIAGAFSMGVGEYISVQSQRELLDYQVAFQRKQLREVPQRERDILTGIYVDRGMREADARRFVDGVFEDEEHAVRLLIFEEVGLDERSIGSPMAAAAGSFVAFTAGAIIPLVPYLLIAHTGAAFNVSLLVSLAALALLGTGIGLLTRRPIPYAALRQVLLGGVAAAVTFVVGQLIGGAPA